MSLLIHKPLILFENQNQNNKQCFWGFGYSNTKFVSLRLVVVFMFT